MSWIYLVIAGLFEVGFTTCLKFSNNFSNWKWSTGFFICITLSFLFLNQSIQKIPIGTAYAVWTGIGAVGTVIMGIFLFSEPSDFWRVLNFFTDKLYYRVEVSFGTLENKKSPDRGPGFFNQYVIAITLPT